MTSRLAAGAAAHRRSSAASTITAAISLTAAARGLAVVLAGLFGGPSGEDGLAREPNLAGRIDVDHHYGELVAELHDVLDAVHAIVGKLRNMDHAVETRQNLDEGAEVGDARYPAGVDLPDLRILGHAADARFGGGGAGAVG